LQTTILLDLLEHKREVSERLKRRKIIEIDNDVTELLFEKNHIFLDHGVDYYRLVA